MRRPRLHTGIAAIAGAALALSALVSIANSPSEAAAANPVTPGNFTGLGFDQCNAPSQHAMDVWKSKSPFSAVGIYISGNSRFCKEQKNLTSTWVRNQLAKGWHLLPITLGPQANCSTRFPRYGATIDPTIRPSSAYTYAKARAQGRAEAAKAVAAAKALGIVPGSTLFYDIEGWDAKKSTACNRSAMWFLSSWSNELHRLRYLSGVYSSVGSGIKLLDKVRKSPPAHYVVADMIWLARWDGKANTSSTQYIPDTGWANHQRVKQYQGGHNEKHGGVTINIDRNYLDVRTRAVPRHIAEPADPPGPQDTSKCTRTSISRYAYRRTSKKENHALVVPLQCLLAQQHRYTVDVTGNWNPKTLAAVQSFQRSIGHPVRTYVTRSDWVALVTIGSSTRVLRAGSTGPDVIRFQRAMNAATKRHLKVTGKFNPSTERAALAYRKKMHLLRKATVNPTMWRLLHRGRW